MGSRWPGLASAGKGTRFCAKRCSERCRAGSSASNHFLDKIFVCRSFSSATTPSELTVRTDPAMRLRAPVIIVPQSPPKHNMSVRLISCILVFSCQVRPVYLAAGRRKTSFRLPAARFYFKCSTTKLYPSVPNVQGCM